jgi:hypothetical protein
VTDVTQPNSRNGEEKAEKDEFDKKTHGDATLIQALRYVETGIAVLPLEFASKKPDADVLPKNEDGEPSWKPLAKKLPTREQLTQWFGGEKPRNIGVVCGEVSGNLVVLDSDDEPHGMEQMEYFLAKSIEDICQITLAVKTARGLHVYLRTKRPVKPEKFEDIHFEIRSGVHYCVAPPSIHETGIQYQFLSQADVVIEVSDAWWEEWRGQLDERVEEWRFVRLLLPSWKEGRRQSLTMGYAGYCRKVLGFTLERAKKSIELICLVTRDEEAEQRQSAVEGTYAKPESEVAIHDWLGEELHEKLKAVRCDSRVNAEDLPDDLAERIRKLWNDVIAAVKRWRHFDDPMSYVMMTLFIFQCHCTEVLPSLFYLFIHGGMGSGKSGIARLIAHLGDGICSALSTPAAMIRDLRERPRLVTIDEFDSPTDPTMKALEHSLLRAGYQRGTEKRVCDPENGNVVIGLPLFGPRILVYRTVIEDEALTTRGYELTTSPYRGGEEGYEYVRANAFDIDLHLKSLRERLDEFATFVRNPRYWSLEKSYQVTGSDSFKEKMRAVLGETFSANRQTELAMCALLVAEIVGVDVVEELKKATSARMPLADDDLAEVELFKDSLEELALSTTVRMNDTVRLVKQSDVKARIDARRVEQRRKRTSPQVFALIRERAGVDESADTILINNAVYLKWPLTPPLAATSQKKHTPLATQATLPTPDWSSLDRSSSLGVCPPLRDEAGGDKRELLSPKKATTQTNVADSGDNNSGVTPPADEKVGARKPSAESLPPRWVEGWT